MRQTYDNKVDAVSSKHTQEMADQKAYFEKELRYRYHLVELYFWN